MNTPTTSASSAFDTSNLLCAPSTSTPKSTPLKELQQNNKSNSLTIQNDITPGSSSSVYDSALENLPTFNSFDESINNNSSSCESFHTECNNNSSSIDDSSSDLDSTLNSSDILKLTTSTTTTELSLSNKIIAHDFLLTKLRSESTDTSSQEEVDIKSQLANKTIFKTNNPNLSIIEIPINSIQELDENSIVLIEKPSDNEDNDDETTPDNEIAKKYRQQKQKKSPIKNNMITATAAATTTATTVTTDVATKSTIATADAAAVVAAAAAAAEKRRKKTESLIQFSKQKLNTDIAEASAAEFKIQEAFTEKDETLMKNGNLKTTTSIEQSENENEIKIYDTIEEFENNLPETVTLLRTPFGSKVYLVGTAHFSENSQNDVSSVIRNVRPDVVLLELCHARIHILKFDEKTLLEEVKNINLAKIRSVIQTNGYINGIFFILLLQMSAQIAKDLGMAPGGEFRRALEEINKLPGCVLQLGDRPIRITIHRALRALTLWQTIKMVWHLSSNDTLSVDEVEKCKQQDLLEKLMKDMAGEFPAFSDVFVKERDIYLCHSLQVAAVPTTDSNGVQRPVNVVGIIGIGHARGIAQMWGQVHPQMIPNLMSIPPASLSTRICKYTIKYGLVALTLYGAYKIARPRLGRFF